MAGKIFINYRRGDDAGFTQALYLRLEDEFKAENLFMDVEGHIKPDDDFVRVLDAQVAASDIVLAVIGPRWSELMAKRDGDPDDFVAIEIKSALDQGKRVIPVLVGGAMMPKADVLPETIRAMARRNAVGLRPDRFKADCQGLIGALKEQLAEAQREREATSARERAAVEEARKQREAEEAQRLAAAEARGREQQRAGLTAEEIRKAEELANWEFIKDSNQQQEFRDHLARFPKGVVERNVRSKLETVLWDSIFNATSDDLFVGERLASFQTEFPDGKFAAEAKALRAKFAQKAKDASELLARMLAERDAWADASAKNTKADYTAFLNAWPDAEYVDAAKERIKELGGGKTRRWLMQGAGASLGAAGVGAMFLPGYPGWRMLYDQSVRTFTGHSRGVSSVAFAPDGKTALSGSYDNTLKLWDVATGKLLRTFEGHTRDVNSVAFAPDGKTALSGSNDITLKLWDVATGKLLRTFEGHTQWVNSVAFAPDGKTALSGSSDHTLKLWDVATGKLLRTFEGHANTVTSVAFAPDGNTALSSSWDDTLKLWDVATRKMLRTFEGHTNAVPSLAFAPDGKTALSGSHDNTLKLWDVTTGKLLRNFEGHTEGVWSVAFAPVGRSALSGSNDNTLKLWDVPTGELLRTFEGHLNNVNSVAFSPDGKTSISGSNDNTLKLWDLTR